MNAATLRLLNQQLVAMYLILTLAVFTLSPLTYALLRRIPLIRWCVLGEKT